MIIDENLLLENGAVYEDYPAKEVVFHEGDTPHYYFQIVQGIVELNNYHEDGKEFTLNILKEGQSIGESLLFSDNKYPMNAIARIDCRVLKLSKCNFLQLVSENHDVMLSIFSNLSDRLYYKYIMLFNNSAIEPCTKIKSLLDYYKRCPHKHGQYTYEIPLTRQQVANLTGLRVETVIRALKKMEREEVVKIEGRQLLY